MNSDNNMTGDGPVNNDSVTLTVDTTICVGIGQCEMLEPEVFFIDDEAISTVVDGATLPADRAARVIERCPSGAISIVPLSDDDSPA